MPSNLPLLLSFYCESYQLKLGPAISPKFSSKIAPKISILKYLDRLFEYFRCSDECYIVALIYIQRLQQFVQINKFNIHRILLVSLMLSAKFLDDSFYSNYFYAQIGGITNRELNQLETQFLETISYKLLVSEQQFNECQQSLYQLEQKKNLIEQEIIM